MSNDIMEQSRIWSSYAAKQFLRYDSGIDPNERSAWFVEQLEKYDFSSVLEVGVCTGRNLKYISEKFPNAMLSGIDVNSDILEKARAQVPNADIMVKDIYDLEEDKKWDLVFTMGVLIHIHPDGIKDAIKKCINVSNKYIIHIEQYGDGSVSTGPKELNPEDGDFGRLYWRPNIVKIYKELGFNNVTVIDVPGEFNKTGASHMIFVDIGRKDKSKPVIDKSLELWNSGINLIPRGTQTMSKAPNQFVFGVHPIYIEKGDGCKLQDIDGNWYVDYLCSLGPIILGHNHSGTVKAVIDQLKKGITFSMMSPVEVELAELLVEIIPCAEQIRYAKNGTDATLGAVRLARSYTKKPVILKPEGHYHGWGDWHAITTTITDGIPVCLKDSIRTFEYNDLVDLEKHLKADDIAAVIMEPTVLIPPQAGYLAGVRSLCDKYSVVLIFDEIVTGFRWALGGAQEYYGVTPDIATFGKAVANGMPLSIIAGKEKYMKEFDNIFFSMTFGGEACSIAAAVAVVKEMKNNKQIFSHIWEKGNELKKGFNELAKKHGVKAEMVGSGPRQVVVFYEDDSTGYKDLFSQEMIKRGFIVGNIIYVTWAHCDRDINGTISAMDESFAVLRKAIDKNGVDSFLEGQRSAAIFKSQAANKK